MPLTQVQAQMYAGGPAFSAYASATQSLSGGVYQKVQFQAEEFDTANCYDNTTNYRFTPNVAGYYQINASAAPLPGTYPQVVIYKNGSAAKGGLCGSGAGNTNYSSIVSALVYCNGSTDYIEIYAFSSTSSTLNAASKDVYFQAFMARAA